MSKPVVRVFKIFILILGVLPLISPQNQLRAQDENMAFRDLSIGLSVQQNTNRNYFHDHWTPSPRLQLALETPFYVGDFTVKGKYARFETETTALPDFDNVQISVGWNTQLVLTDRLHLGGGGSLLFATMFFYKASEEAALRARNTFGSTSPESEIGVALQGNLTWQMSSAWSLQLTFSRDIIYTDTKIKLNYVGVDIVRTVQMPRWLQEVLR